VLDDLAARGALKGKVGVFSMGMGTTIALQWAARDPRVGPVVAVSPVNQIEAAFTKQAEGMRPAPSPETVRQALALVADRLGIQWTDWSGETALRQMREPVLFIRGDHDSLCSAEDLKTMQQAAPAGSQSIEVAGADRLRAQFFFQELTAPVTNWFAAHLAK
jgi:pimeloyl-ACP methyl ester carboxylesterase